LSEEIYVLLSFRLKEESCVTFRLLHVHHIWCCTQMKHIFLLTFSILHYILQNFVFFLSLGWNFSCLPESRRVNTYMTTTRLRTFQIFVAKLYPACFSLLYLRFQ